MLDLPVRMRALLAGYMALSCSVWVMTVVMLVGRVTCSGLGQMWIIICLMIVYNILIFATRGLLMYNTFVKHEIKWRTLFISTEVAQIPFFASIPLTLLRLKEDAVCWYRNETYGDDVPFVLGWICTVFAIANLALMIIFFRPPLYPPTKDTPVPEADTHVPDA
ncbi:hypothetical protein DIPPA_16894 [Diplonema papillatum]|nr:hypothetical protein DIPPA_16894 [Diplonema papillatum]